MFTLNFFLTALAFIFGTAFFNYLAYISIQQEQWFDLLFKWQDRLQKWGESTNKFDAVKYKIFGGCYLCFSHLLSVCSFCLFVVSFSLEWFSTPTFLSQVFANVGFYLVYVCTATTLSVITFNKWTAKND